MAQEKNNNPEDISLKDLIDIKEWQKIQDSFSAVTEIGIRTIDPNDNLITTPSGESRLCRQLLKNSPQKTSVCGPCLPTFLGGQQVLDKNLSFVCRAGLSSFLVPLRLNEDKVVGYIILGPVILVIRKPKEEYCKTAEELGLDLEELWSALLEIKAVSLFGIKSLVDLIGDVCEYTINLAYKTKVKERGVMMGLDAAGLSRIFDLLLDVAFEVSQADVGSVMFFDETQQSLTIRSSRGIPDEIVRKARVRLGEGISGIAASQGKSFLIDDNIRDSRIRPYLNRPYLGSSMVIPIKVGSRVAGIMNLGVLKTSAVRFNVDNVAMMNKLIDLVAVAIAPVK